MAHLTTTQSLIMATAFAATPSILQAQTACGPAVAQLQQYVIQVNQIANHEYGYGIPIRCGGNMYCANTFLYQLNSWYQQQSNNVNYWYAAISAACTSPSSPKPTPPLPPSSASDPIKPNDIEEIEVEDEDQVVAIKIPSNPNGFKPK